MAPKPTAAGSKLKLSTKRSRKSRTEIVESSSSGSSSDSESSSSAASDPPAALKPSKKQKTTAAAAARDNTTASTSDDSSSLSSSSDDSELSDATIPPASAAAAAFPSWYLRSVTQELAEDLDKVRGAPDFGDAALPLLVHALQQGEACFSQAEKARVMGGGAAAAARD